MLSGIYLKLISIAVAVAIAFAAAWSWRGSIAESEITEAVNTAVVKTVEDIRADLTKEREARIAYQQTMQETLTAMQTDIRRVQRIRAQTGKDVAQDIRDNGVFYSQPLPDLGRQAWIAARESAAASAPASSPSP